MDVSDVEENLFKASNAKLHGGMYRQLAVVLCKVLGIFPALEAARPRSKSGIQALCSLHVAVEKAKGLLQHCSNCSKLYLAITGDSVLLKFEKARCALEEGLRRVEDIVPKAIGCQILEIVSEIEGIVFALDTSEKQVGDEVIALLQQERKFNSSSNDYSELETFRQVVLKLHITSPRAALIERRALKRLIERARVEDDKRKESIIAYLLHLLRKYSKLFRSEFSDDNDSQGSTPCSPTVQGSFEECSGPIGNGHAFQRQLSKLSSFNFKTNGTRSGNLPIPPEEFRCPISLQLMYDPVIISSGQTYERACIEKWFSDGHSTCPKTQQQLSHLFLTPNYCVKDLIARWCEYNGIPIPDGPPESLDLNYWRLALSESEVADSRSIESIESCKPKVVMVVPPKSSEIVELLEESDLGNLNSSCQDAHDKEVYMFERCERFLAVLNEGENIRRQLKVVEQIRLLLKDDGEARNFMGANGFVEALIRFLRLAVHQKNEKAQGTGVMALFNLAVNNNRNKEMILSQGVIQILEEMISNSNAYESVTALFLNLSCHDKAKPIIGSSRAVPFLVRLLQTDSDPQCKLDALHTVYNLSTLRSNISRLLSAGIIDGLQALMSTAGPTTDHMWAEKSIAVLSNLALNKSGKKEIVSEPGIISQLAAKLEGEPAEQEQAASCLFILCNEDEKCSQMVLQEGVIPALVSVSVNGTTRGKEKARKLLILFRDQRQQDSSHVEVVLQVETSTGAPELKPTCKLTSNKPGRTWSSMWKKSKSYSVYQC